MKSSFPSMLAVFLVATAWLACIHTNHAASFFETLGLTPGEVAASASRPPAPSLASLPASTDERQELIDALLQPAPANSVTRRAADAAVILELWGEHARALEILEKHPDDSIVQLHRVRLHYRMGDPRAAAEVFATIPPQPESNSLADHPFQRLDQALIPWIVERKYAEAQSFLKWMQPQCLGSEWRTAVLAHRLELALHLQPRKSPLDQLAGESAVTRSIAATLLDPSSPPFKPTARDIPIIDLAWLVSHQQQLEPLAPWIERVIRSGAGKQSERAELFRQIMLRWNVDQPRTRWLSEWMTRDAECMEILRTLVPRQVAARSMPYDALCRLAARHPANVQLNLLAGINQTNRSSSQSQVVVTQGALDCLRRAFDHSPLLASGPEDASFAIFFADDPARTALRHLAPRLSSSELHKMLMSREDFHILPLPRRLAYLAAADLQRPMVDAIMQTDWSDPSHDGHGWVWKYFRAFDFDLIENEGIPLREFLIRIIMGSSEKPAARVAEHSSAILQTLFARPPSGPVNQALLVLWHRTLMERGMEFAQAVVAEGQRYRSAQPPDFDRLAGLLGDDVAAVERRHHEKHIAHFAKLRACAWFGPESIHGFPMGYSQRQIGEMLTSAWPGWIGEHESLLPPQGWLMHRYPALASIVADCEYDSTAGETAKWAATLRSILDPADPIATAYGIAIQTGTIKQPAASETEWADAHFGEMLRTRTDADFVLYRASFGISLRHAQPAANPQAIMELTSLRGAAAPLRIAAIDIVRKTHDIETSEQIVEVLQTHGTPQPILRQGLAGPPPPQLPPPPLLKRKLESATDIDAICGILAGYPDLNGQSRFSMLTTPFVIEYFKTPHHVRLLDLLAIQPEPALRTHGNREILRNPNHQQLFVLHAFFQEQDDATVMGDSARKFRQLAMMRGWICSNAAVRIGRVLMTQGDRNGAIGWYAHAIVQLRSPLPKHNGIHRFPIRSRTPEIHMIEEYLPPGILADLANHDLAVDVAQALADMPGGGDAVVIGFLRFFDAPAVSSFETYLDEIVTPANPALAGAFRIRSIRLLERVERTRTLAAELAKP